jgi:UDP-N-acetyl-D-glucosamine/UDP-N-acetyl-D-galactosamine dehydrogenase
MNNNIIGVIGLGYVGLPLAVEFCKYFKVIGFDVNEDRIQKLRRGIDDTLEITAQELENANNLLLTHDKDELKSCNIYIVTVPTPVDKNNRPDFYPLISASKIVGANINLGDIVIYESTVYPGATEEICVPILEEVSGLKFNQDFFVGYSPERINPGDKSYKLPNIKKIVSGSSIEVGKKIQGLYEKIITAGTHLANSIKIAEAAKVIENTQRDVNIALINELAIIFNKLNIDTDEVLIAAGTKWNFLPFRPGLVGGHCIGVDPYYLTHKAQEIGYHPEIILAGRRINDAMGEYVAAQLIKFMLKKKIYINGSKILILGITFKENCPDIRNTKVLDVIDELREFGCDVEIYDPWVKAGDRLRVKDAIFIDEIQQHRYDGIILAVPHANFCRMQAHEIRRYGKNPHVFFDMKSIFSKEHSDIRL